MQLFSQIRVLPSFLIDSSLHMHNSSTNFLQVAPHVIFFFLEK